MKLFIYIFIQLGGPFFLLFVLLFDDKFSFDVFDGILLHFS